MAETQQSSEGSRLAHVAACNWYEYSAIDIGVRVSCRRQHEDTMRNV
jgi:hypothetical protein